MADKELFELTAAALPLSRAELLYLVQGGNTRKAAISDVDQEADQVPYDPTASGMAATDVQAAIDELKDAIGGGGSDAADIAYDNSTSGMAATDVQEAIDELHADIAAIEFSFFFASTFLANELLAQHIASRAFSLPSALSGSHGGAGVAATASTVLTIKKNGSSAGTATWAISGTVPTLAMASPTSFAIGDVMTIVAPGTPDATLANVSLSLLGSLT
ncbi:hypothetical protein EOA37_09735 [Mesorhizobium sp. M2A.F.Ca.ET.015.02.1.1]|uniref:hypothetical protein n=1 Tax=Mesorhizobium sp. M2A.F.Ca.ET.015.02.1.1 TaxID=2496758 RepID=UPI000FCB0EC5|nr:hypothetical protein [Mesorhizobium sp. M2A.F.Ca.ET.015.02.1.1]RUW41532.1 hypothetical protein EOA37_09735 [Mesorhizobium sp. M2A.F.Ca.ET.015.02.1.1]